MEETEIEEYPLKEHHCLQMEATQRGFRPIVRVTYDPLTSMAWIGLRSYYNELAGEDPWDYWVIFFCPYCKRDMRTWRRK